MRKRRWWQRLLGVVGTSLARTGHALSRQAGEADSAVAPELVGEPPAHWLELLSQSEVPLVWLERQADDTAPRHPPAGWQTRLLWHQASSPAGGTEPAAPETAEMPAGPTIARPHYQPAVPSPREPLPVLRMPGAPVQPGAAKRPRALPDQSPVSVQGRQEARGPETSDHWPADASLSPPPVPALPNSALPDQPERLSRRPLLRWFHSASAGKVARPSTPTAPMPGLPPAGTHFSPPQPAGQRPAHYAGQPAALRRTLPWVPDTTALNPARPEYGDAAARETPPSTTASPLHYGRRQRPSPAESRWPEPPPATEVAAIGYQAMLPPTPARPSWPGTAPAAAARSDPFAADPLPAEQWPALPPDWLVTEPASSPSWFEEAHQLRLEQEQRGE